jgi:DNA polymerase I-like protein with 3'-5' exonuclease and polymerase domains
VNLAIQSTGSILMDYSQAWMDKQLGGVSIVDGVYPCYTTKGSRVYRVLYQHDEYVYSCDPVIADYVKELGKESIKRAGEFFKLKVPLLSTASIGKNWAEIH